MNQNPDDMTGTLLVLDVPQGVPSHVKRDGTEDVQIMEQAQKSRCMAVGEAWGHTPIIRRRAVHVRPLIGVVPIEEDDSAYFVTAALRIISFSVLDAEDGTLVRMNSDVHIMSWERRSSIGCHEYRREALIQAGWRSVHIAAHRPPSTPRRPKWGANGLIDSPKMGNRNLEGRPEQEKWL